MSSTASTSGRCPRRCCRARATAAPWPRGRSGAGSAGRSGGRTRTAMPSWSSAAPTSSVREPSSTNDSTPAFSGAVPIRRRPGTARSRARRVRRAARARSAAMFSMPIADHVVERRAEPDRVGDVAGAGLEAARRRAGTTVLSKVTSCDHVAAALPGRHRSSTLALAVDARRCRSGRTPCGRRRRRSRSRAPARRPACARPPARRRPAPWRRGGAPSRPSLAPA